MHGLISEGGVAEQCVGYYADIEGDGIVDGIIYADLLFGNTGSGTWGDKTYAIEKKTNVKQYEISQASHTEEIFGTRPVITPVKGSVGDDRFYVMALQNMEDSSGEDVYDYTWYYNADGKIENFSDITSEDFGTGRQNTETMINKWTDKEYGEPYVYTSEDGWKRKDMWGNVKNEYTKGWFVPSIGEWAAFADQLNIEKLYGSEGSMGTFWSSSLAYYEEDYDGSYSNRAYEACLERTCDGWWEYSNNRIIYSELVRLSTTF